MPADRLKPIFSSHANDPEASAIVDDLVHGLGERIDELQDVEVELDYARISELATGLATDAERAGFSELSRAAATLATESARRDAEFTHDRLVDLTHVSHRVRLGHKGAA